MQINRQRLALKLFSTVLLLLLTTNIFADDFQPLYVEVNTSATGTVTARVKPPPGLPQYQRVTLGLPDFCVPQNNPQNPGTFHHHNCSASLEGETLRLVYPGTLSPLPAVLRLTQDGSKEQVLTLPAHNQSWTQPATGAFKGVALQYSVLGIEHIWIGYDHLLFLLCVIWIAGTGKRVLWMITGFTAAHSITLALATFQIIRINIAWVETAIALSVLFLALEITRNRRDTITWRFPATVSTLFGLLHGFGFASVLAEIGLPNQERFKGLLFFNIGVEIGQLLFILASVSIYFALQALLRQRFRLSKPLNLQPIVGYSVGCIAAFWFIERFAQLGS